MKITYARGMWGMSLPNLEDNLKLIATAYDAVEMRVPDDPAQRDDLNAMLEEYGLEIIAQQLCWGANPTLQMQSFEKQYLNAVAMGTVRFVNSHTGRDYFTPADNAAIIAHASNLEAKHGLKIVHEIHRGRATFCSPALNQLLDAQPETRLCVDLSHWCCVHESLLADQAESVERALQAGDHLHARVGYSQGPQVPDPRAPEWADALNAHLAWWDRYVEIHRERHAEDITICPEFGPYPYMVQQPHTRQNIVDLWDVNLWIKELLQERYRDMN